jgi:hypothetical protein
MEVESNIHAEKMCWLGLMHFNVGVLIEILKARKSCGSD